MSPEHLDLFCTQALLGENIVNVNGHVDFTNTRISFVCEIEKERIQIKIRGKHVKCVKINSESPALILIVPNEE